MRRHGHIEGGANHEGYIVYCGPDDLTLEGTLPPANCARGTEVPHPGALKNTPVSHNTVGERRESGEHRRNRQRNQYLGTLAQKYMGMETLARVRNVPH